MIDEEKLERLMSRMTGAIVNTSGLQSKLEIIAKRLGELEPNEVVCIMEKYFDGYMKNPDYGMVFLTLLEMSRERKEFPPGFKEDLRHEIITKRPTFNDVWNRFQKLNFTGRSIVKAKTSLLMEVQFLLHKELKDSAATGSTSPADELALHVLKSTDPISRILQVETTRYSSGVWLILEEILSELDFIESSSNLWRYTITESSINEMSEGENFIKHLTGSAKMTQVIITRLVGNLVKRLCFIIRSTGMYPSGHPAIQPAVDSFMSALNKLLSDSPMVTFTLVGSDLMINEVQIRKKTRALDLFIRDMSERNINSISFHPGIGQESVLHFAAVFNKPPVYIREHGGIERLLERREIRHITIDQFHYALISGDGTIIGKAESPEQTALEDAIFGEVVERLERGDTLRDLADEKVGMALKSVLLEAGSGVEKQRNMLASFVAALDPSILEKGLLSRRDIQRDMAWSAVRKIIKTRLKDLESEDDDIRLEALEKVMQFAQVAVERNKDNTLMQTLEGVTQIMAVEYNPDCIFASISAMGSLLERLISRGKLASAEIAAVSLKYQETAEEGDPDLISSRRRALAEARRRIDTPEVADALFIRLLSRNEVAAQEAENLVGKLPLTNLVSRLLEVFVEPDIHQRAKAYRVLRKLGEKILPILHGRLIRLTLRYETQRDEETGRLVSDDWFVVRNIIKILGDFSSTDSIDVLEDLCRDSDDRVRQIALLTLLVISRKHALNASLRMINDKSAEVSRVALDIAAKEASDDPLIIDQLIAVFEQRPAMWGELLHAFEGISYSKAVKQFIAGVFKSGELLPFGSLELAKRAVQILGRSTEEQYAQILEEYLDQVKKPGLIKKKKISRSLITEVKSAITRIRNKK